MGATSSEFAVPLAEAWIRPIAPEIWPRGPDEAFRIVRHTARKGREGDAEAKALFLYNNEVWNEVFWRGAAVESPQRKMV